MPTGYPIVLGCLIVISQHYSPLLISSGKHSVEGSSPIIWRFEHPYLVYEADIMHGSLVPVPVSLRYAVL